MTGLPIWEERVKVLLSRVVAEKGEIVSPMRIGVLPPEQEFNISNAAVRVIKMSKDCLVFMKLSWLIFYKINKRHTINKIHIYITIKL